MSPDYVDALQSLDRSDPIYRDSITSPITGCLVRRELLVQSDGTITLHSFSDDPEDADAFDVEPLDYRNLVSWLRDHWSDDATGAPRGGTGRTGAEVP